MKRKQSLLLIWLSLLIVSMACSLTGGAAEEPEAPDVNQTEQEDVADEQAEASEEVEAEEAAEAEHEAEDMSEESQEYDTEFPLPEDVQNFTGGGDQVNFATNITVEEAIEFYRTIFAEIGLTERTLNTAITETTFSMVFDGHAKGEAIVVQGVDLGNGTTNINIRFEDV
ncbi:MAG: hypothetical protein ISR58_06675 [Anaerolineales bacterium]|nr:hypothetical protein [Chloroflexota bacterium]MBL6980858.1 hypothetical protein [Anaerolineales bacterium]